jgi:hypothetical protein
MDAIQRIARAIQQGQGSYPASAPGMTPLHGISLKMPPIPQYQIPGMNTLAGGGFTNTPSTPAIQRGPSVAMPPTTQAMPAAAPAMPQMPAPMPMGMPPGMQQPGALPPLPPTQQIGAAPGMGQSPNTLDEWRAALDAMQFGRQGQ